MKMYIAPHVREAERDWISRLKEKWERYFFCEWVFFFFCRKAIATIARFGKQDRYLGDAYDLFTSKYWYYPKNAGIVGRVSIEMTRELNMAFGLRFRATRQEFFVEFVKSLAASKYYSDKKNALYIIKHTVFTEGRDDVRVSAEFQPILRSLLMDPKFEKEAIHNCRFISLNVGKMPTEEYRRLKDIEALWKSEKFAGRASSGRGLPILPN